MKSAFALFFLAGIFGGIFGGMGFGGGTILIPILTILLKVPFPAAVWVNLVAFLPAAACALSVHVRNGMIEWKEVLFLLIFGAIGVTSAFLIKDRISTFWLKGGFGCFLIILGSFSIISVFIGYIKKKRQ